MDGVCAAVGSQLLQNHAKTRIGFAEFVVKLLKDVNDEVFIGGLLREQIVPDAPGQLLDVNVLGMNLRENIIVTT